MKTAIFLITLISLAVMVMPGFATNKKFRLFKSEEKELGYLKPLDNMLFLLNPKADRATRLIRFFLLSFIVFIFTFILSFYITVELPKYLPVNFMTGQKTFGSKGMGVLFSASIAVFSTVVYFYILKIRYHFRRVRASYDLLEVVKVLPRFSYASVDEALFLATEQLSPKNVLIQPIRVLALSLTSYSSQEEIQEEITRFIAVINTTFAVAFTSDMLFAYREGSVWKDSLAALANSMEFRHSVIIEGKKKLSAPIHTGIWMNLVTLIAMCGAVAYTIGWNVYSQLQFQTKIGVYMLTLILILCLITMANSLALLKPALDHK